MKTIKKCVISFRTDEKLNELLKTNAGKKGINVSQYIEQVLRINVVEKAVDCNE